MHELDVLEVRRIAELALEARKVRDRLLEKVPDSDLGEPKPARGEHNPAANLVLNGVLAGKAEFVALREAIAALPRDVREKLWVVMRIGSGDSAILDWDDVLAAASALADGELVGNMVEEPDLHHCLRKGLYALGAANLPGGTR